MGVYIWMALTALALVGAYQWLLARQVPPPPKQSMDADLYPVNEGWIVHRRAEQDPEATVIVMHGFLESPFYFSRFYDDPRIELIMLVGTGYQLPVHAGSVRAAQWTFATEQQPGTIAADAELVNLALEHLPSSRNLQVHGHSRGGAVVLEAARQRPDLFSTVEVLLEAPALPQGRPWKPQPAIARWLLPLVHLLWQGKPHAALSSPVWGPLRNGEKREMILAMPFNPASSRLMMTNLRDLLNWMETTGTDIYRHVQRGAILVPERDRILDSGAMLDSARQAENLQIIEVAAGSHFVLLDHPQSIPPLLRNP